jgi:hypothetical protein
MIDERMTVFTGILPVDYRVPLLDKLQREIESFALDQLRVVFRPVPRILIQFAPSSRFAICFFMVLSQDKPKSGCHHSRVYAPRQPGSKI